MTDTCLTSIREDIKKFLSLVKDVVNLLDDSFPHLSTMTVIINNMTFCKNEEELHKYLNVIEKFRDYYDSHFENFIYKEISHIVYNSIAFKEMSMLRGIS